MGCSYAFGRILVSLLSAACKAGVNLVGPGPWSGAISVNDSFSSQSSAQTVPDPVAESGKKCWNPPNSLAELFLEPSLFQCRFPFQKPTRPCTSTSGPQKSVSPFTSSGLRGWSPSTWKRGLCIAPSSPTSLR